MNSYKAAISKLNNNSLKIGSEIVSIKDALNRISSKEVIAKSDYPADDNTAFDGFAVNSKETKNTFQKFKILKTIAAGDNPYIKKVPKLSCIEVMTGAIIKKPFDTIIPIEDIEFFPSKQNAKYIIINKKIKKSEFIRPKGSDYKKGNKIIRKGELINPAHILSLKTLGIDKVLVKKKVNIVFYPSGNELSDKKNIPSWKIRNSNTIYLNSLIKSLPVNFTVQKILRDKDQKLFWETEEQVFPLIGLVYYIKAPTDGGKLVFPEDGATVTPKERRLIIFERHMLHYVIEFKGERVSLGINPWDHVPTAYRR